MTEDARKARRRSPPSFRRVKGELHPEFSSYDEGVLRIVYEMIVKELFTTEEDHFTTGELSGVIASGLKERKISIVNLERIVEEIARVLAPGAGFVKARMRDYRTSLEKIVWSVLARRMDPAGVDVRRMAREIIALIETEHTLIQKKIRTDPRRSPRGTALRRIPFLCRKGPCQTDDLGFTSPHAG